MGLVYGRSPTHPSTVIEVTPESMVLMLTNSGYTVTPPPIGNNIFYDSTLKVEVVVRKVSGKKVRLEFNPTVEAPDRSRPAMKKEVAIHRKEVFERILKQRKAESNEV